MHHVYTHRPTDHYSSSHSSLCLQELTLIIEAVYPIDASTLVVATEKEEILRVFDLVGQQQADGFQRLLPSVNIVTEKEVVGLWRERPVLKHPQQVCILSVYIACI